MLDITVLSLSAWIDLNKSGRPYIVAERTGKSEEEDKEDE